MQKKTFYHNHILELTRSSKKNFYQNYFTEHNDNLRKIWQGVKEIIDIKGKSNNIPVCVTKNKEIITEPTGVRNAFNNYYSNIAENILIKCKYAVCMYVFNYFTWVIRKSDSNVNYLHP